MKTTHFPSLKNMTDDEIFDYYCDHMNPKNCLSYINHIFNERPDTELNLVGMFEQTKEFDEPNYEAILEFAEHYRKINPDKYRQEYEFVELHLTDHAFDIMDKALINRCIKVIEENPVKGIDTVTKRTLFRLIYFGMYREAVDYCEKVREPISKSEEIWGNPEIHFLMALYLQGAEEQYELFCKGDTSGWKDFITRIKEYGFDNEAERIDAVFRGLSADLDKEKILLQIKNKPDYGLIELQYHFLRFMKHRYNIPFMHSNLLFYLVLDQSLFGSIKEEDAWFYIPYPKLDSLVRNKIDIIFGTNCLDVGGNLWGLHYVYEFLHENQLISAEYYRMMLENLAWLKMDFLTMVKSEAWQMKFVLKWPDTDSNLVKLPENFFDSIDRKEDQNALAQIKNLLPHVDGKDRIILELRRAAGNKNKTNQYGPAKIAGAEIPPDPNRYVRRNDPCPCGSGKKFKKCCLGKVENNA